MPPSQPSPAQAPATHKPKDPWKVKMNQKASRTNSETASACFHLTHRAFWGPFSRPRVENRRQHRQGPQIAMHQLTLRSAATRALMCLGTRCRDQELFN